MKHRFFLSFLLVLTLLTSVCCSPAMAVETEYGAASEMATEPGLPEIMPLAQGCGLSGCTCTNCSWYYSNQKDNGVNNYQHLATVRCSGCSAKMDDWEPHRYSNTVCTICGHRCSHSGHEYTKKKVGTCAYEESCYYCKQLIRTSYQHSASYGSWRYYDSEKHVANGSCSKCGSTFSKYENHSLTTSYEQYTASQHKVIKHCSTCSEDITSYAVHSFTYGPWADFDNDQHRRTVKCTSCAYSTYGYAGHTDANGDDLCDVCKHLMTRFSVTVPTSMAMAVSEQGKVTAATNAVILNHSTGAVKLTGLKITAENGWQLIPFARDLAGTKVDSKQIGFRIAGCDTLLQGTQEQLDITNLGNVPKDSSLSLPYAAVVSAMSQPVNEQVLTVEFTVDWAA